MKNFLLSILLMLVMHHFNFAQILTDFPCYTVNEHGGADPNFLWEFNPAIDEWANKGEIDPIGDLIEAIALTLLIQPFSLP